MTEIFQQVIDRFVELVPSRRARVALAGVAAVGTLLLGRKVSRCFSSNRLPADGKVVLVTGCDTPLGFGTAIARELHQLGYVVFAGCLNAEQARETVHADFKDSTRFQVVQLDVTNQTQVDNCVDSVKKWLKENPGYYFHSVVNNAGIVQFSPLEWFKMENFIKIFDVNCFGVVRVTKSFLPLIRTSSKDGRVVIISSMAASVSSQNCSPYSGSKAAIVMISNCLRIELADLNVKVSVINPDFYRTNINDGANHLPILKLQAEAVDKDTYEAYGGDNAVTCISGFLSNEVPKLAKPDLSPLTDCVVDAIANPNPQRLYEPIDAFTYFLKWLYHYFPYMYEAMRARFSRKMLKQVQLQAILDIK